MLKPDLLANDINSMCKLIEKYCEIENENNKVIYEVLGYINESFLKTLL